MGGKVIARDAVPSDIPEIIPMAVDFWKYSPMPEIPPDPLTIEVICEHCIESKLLCVLEIDGKIEGFAAGTVAPSLVNINFTVGNELAWWVNPDHRAGRNGIKLLKYLENMAKIKGVDYWVMVFMESSMPDAIEGIYVKSGYAKGETSYVKRLK